TSGAAGELKVLAGGDDGDDEAGQDVQHDHGQDKEEGRGGEALEQQEGDQAEDEQDHRQGVIDDRDLLARRRFQQFEEQQNQRQEQDQVARADVPGAAGHHRNREQGFTQRLLGRRKSTGTQDTE